MEANEGPARVGYMTVAGETLSVYQSGAVAPASVCSRTPQVRDAIASAVGSDCAGVSEFDMLEVSRLDLSYQRIDALDDGDFTGLVKLNKLSLRSNPIGSVPAGTFRDLLTLRELDLYNTGLTTVPDGITGLSSLELLDLGYNEIERIHRDSFSGLSQLDSLRLYGNRIAALPDGFLADLAQLDSLYLYGNRIADLRKEAWEGPLDLRELYLSENPAPKPPAGRVRQRVDADYSGTSRHATQGSVAPDVCWTGCSQLAGAVRQPYRRSLRRGVPRQQDVET